MCSKVIVIHYYYCIIYLYINNNNKELSYKHDTGETICVPCGVDIQAVHMAEFLEKQQTKPSRRCNGCGPI